MLKRLHLENWKTLIIIITDNSSIHFIIKLSLIDSNGIGFNIECKIHLLRLMNYHYLSVYLYYVSLLRTS